MKVIFVNQKEEMTKKLILVGIEDAEISTEERPIIGTEALATCVGILLYSVADKKAIVGHCSFDVEDVLTKTIDLISQNNIGNGLIKYKIIPGYYYNHYEVRKKLEKFYASYPEVFIPFDEDEISDNAIESVDDIPSHRFAFDASSGKFVTDKVLFGIDYLNISGSQIK